MSSSSQTEEVYATYPRKVAKPAALRKIANAIRNHGFEFILERTKLFASTYNGPLEFIPHPSTWFNQERFLDDPSTWKRNSSTASPRGLAKQFGAGSYTAASL